METREDHFLGGRLRLLQPVRGYRAATDPVLLAAAAPVQPGDCVLDLGCGVGTAALCLGARVSGLKLSGLELQPAYAHLARKNATRNGIELDVHEGDLTQMPPPLRQQSFDCIMMNPPYHDRHDLGSPDTGRDIANREGEVSLAEWISAGLARLRPRGWLLLIHRAVRLPDLLTPLNGRAGAITVLPLAPRIGRDAGRVILRARKGVRTPFKLVSPFILHAGRAHLEDRDDFTDAAQAILRDGGALDF